MRIRMTGDYVYPLDEAGRHRTLPYGGIFDEPDAIALAAVAAGLAVCLDPVPAAADAPTEAASGDGSAGDGAPPADPADLAAPAPTARRPRA